MVATPNKPILLEGLIENLDLVVRLFEENAPYTPLGGWFRPDQKQTLATSPMWFQKDWAFQDFVAEGAELFMWHQRVIETARGIFDAEVVVPRTLYVNLMAAIAESGPVHTDNPSFRGRDRSNTPMMLLRTMLWSGLFEDWYSLQATSIWWLNDVEGGGFLYWPEGPDKNPEEHLGGMANTAVVGDNHSMFHQVEPVGPFDEGTRLVTSVAELAPAKGGGGDWAVTDGGQESFRAPFNEFRASVLWKADVYDSDEERCRLEKETLSLEEMARIFDEDLASRGLDLRFDLARLEDPKQTSQLAEVYPEAIPVGAGVSVFEGRS